MSHAFRFCISCVKEFFRLHDVRTSATSLFVVVLIYYVFNVQISGWKFLNPTFLYADFKKRAFFVTENGY